MIPSVAAHLSLDLIRFHQPPSTVSVHRWCLGTHRSMIGSSILGCNHLMFLLVVDFWWIIFFFLSLNFSLEGNILQISPSAIWLWCHPHQLVDCYHLTSFPMSMCWRFLFPFLLLWAWALSIFLLLSSASWLHSSITAWSVSTCSMYLQGCLHQSPSLQVLVEGAPFFFTMYFLL